MVRTVFGVALAGALLLTSVTSFASSEGFIVKRSAKETNRRQQILVMPSKTRLIKGNPKMEHNLAQTTALLDATASAQRRNRDAIHTALAVSAPHVSYAAVRLKGSGVIVGAQDCSHEKSGNQNGEVSARALVGMGAEYIVVGHPWRRQNKGETNEIINEKAKRAQEAGAVVLLVLGSTENTEVKALDDVKRQLEIGRKGLDESKMFVALEPPGNIGGVEAASFDLVLRNHDALRKEIGPNMRLGYGGSYNENFVGHLQAADFAFVGGACYTPAKWIPTLDASAQWVRENSLWVPADK